MSWALALSGGGLLGAAHIGAYQALAELRLVPDYIAGTSAGGLVGAAISTQLDPARLIDLGRQVLSDPDRYMPFNWHPLLSELEPWRRPDHFLGILDPAPLIQALIACAGNPFGESTARPLLLTTVDIIGLVPWAWTNTPRWSGLAHWQLTRPGVPSLALHSTMAVPGIFVPARNGSHLYVDGGVADDDPVDWALASGANAVIAIDVGVPGPLSPPEATLFDIVGRSLTYLTQFARQPRQDPRVLELTPDTHAFSIWNPANYDPLIRLGYHSVMQNRHRIADHLTRLAAQS